MNYLGLDWGKSKIGLAIGSDETKIASPILILKNDKNAFSELEKIVETEQAEVIVIGKPQSMAGHSGLDKDFIVFVEQIKKLGLKVELEDERLSTKQAQGLMRDFKKTKRAEDDDVAATVILQSYLDKL